MIKLIVAIDKYGGIAFENRLPWKIPEELEHFYQEISKPNVKLLMGRKTFESIPEMRIARDKFYVLTHAEIPNVKCIKRDEIINLFRKYHTSIKHHLYIAGGKRVFEEFYRYAKELVISRIKGEYEADVFIDLDLKGFALVKVEKHEQFNVEHYIRAFDGPLEENNIYENN